MSQADLAKLINVSQPQLVQYEKGRDDVSMAMLLDLEEVLRLRSGHFFRVVEDGLSQARRHFELATTVAANED